MNDIIQFAQNHILMLSVWIILLLTLVGMEMWNRKKRPQQVSPQSLIEMMNTQEVKVVDIRTSQNFKQGHILHSKNIPWLGQDEVAFKAFQNEVLIIVCQQGQQAARLAEELKNQSFAQVMVLDGGVNGWQNENLPLVKGK